MLRPVLRDGAGTSWGNVENQRSAAIVREAALSRSRRLHYWGREPKDVGSTFRPKRQLTVTPSALLPVLAALTTLVGVSVVGACGRDAVPVSSAPTVDTLASGTVYVHNPLEGLWSADPEARWEVVERLRIGRLEDAGPDAFGRIGSVVVDGLDRIWVADVLANRLKVFDSAGRFVREIGRKGRGPGEFMRLGPVFRGPGDEIWVEDLSLSRWEVFDTTGTRIRGYPVLSRLAGGWRRWLPDGRFLVMDLRPDAPDVPVIVEYRRAPDGALVARDTAALPAPRMPPLMTFESRDGRVRISEPVPFSPRPWATLSLEGDLWVSEGDGRYEIRRQRLNGDTLLVIRRAYEPVLIPDSLREASIQALLDRFPGGVPRVGLDLDRVPRAYPPFDECFVSTDGALWVRRRRPDGADGFDVFDGDGLYLGQPNVPSDLGRMRIELITASHIHAVATDTLGVDYVVRFEIHRPAGTRNTDPKS